MKNALNVAAAAMLAATVFAVTAIAQTPARTPKSDPGAGNSIQCWDTQAAVVRDKGSEQAPKNDSSAVAGSTAKGATPSGSTPARTATPEERAQAKRPPDMDDCS